MLFNALDYEIIKCQSDIVNALTKIGKPSKLMGKMDSNKCHLLACSSPTHQLQLLYLGQLELLNKIRRTGDANVDDDEF
jgi:hypothetical protein